MIFIILHSILMPLLFELFAKAFIFFTNFFYSITVR